MTSILDLPITEDRQSHDDNRIPEQPFAVRRLVYAAKLFSGRAIQRTSFERSVIAVASRCNILVDLTDDPQLSADAVSFLDRLIPRAELRLRTSFRRCKSK